MATVFTRNQKFSSPAAQQFPASYFREARAPKAKVSGLRRFRCGGACLSTLSSIGTWRGLLRSGIPMGTWKGLEGPTQKRAWCEKGGEAPRAGRTAVVSAAMRFFAPAGVLVWEGKRGGVLRGRRQAGNENGEHRT